MIRTTLISGAATLVACAAIPGLTSAGQVSYTASVPMQVTNWGTQLTIPKFDPALGELRSVALHLHTHMEGSVGVENLTSSPSPNNVAATLSALVTLFAPGGTEPLLVTAPSYNLPIPPLGPFDGVNDFEGTSGWHSGMLEAPDYSVLVIPPTLPPPLDMLTLQSFIGPGRMVFPAAAQGASIAVGNTGNEQFLFVTHAEALLEVVYDFGTPGVECPPNTRDVPGSLLLFPRFDSREGHATLISVTNTNCSFEPGPGSLPRGTVDAEFVYVGRYGANGEDLPCAEYNRTARLSPCDTLTVLARAHDPNQQRGFLYVFAKDPQTGRAIVFDHLVGQALFITEGSLSEGGRDALNARTFLGVGSAAGTPQPLSTPTDLDNDGVRDLDGLEYTPAPDTLLVPRFLGQDTGLAPIFRSTLTLVNLSGGALFDATVAFTVWNDNEVPFSAMHAFRCWDELNLIDVLSGGGVFTEQFLRTTDQDPQEILGASGPNGRESGWFTVDGVVAASSVDQVIDPVVYAVLCERASGYEVCDLPWELCLDPRGDLYEHGLFDEDAPTYP